MRVATIALLVLGPALAARAQDLPLPPSLAPEVRRLAFGGPLADGSMVVDARIRPTLIELDVRHGDETATVALVPRGQVAPGVRLADTASFSTFLFRGRAAPARALVARIAARDRGTSLDAAPIRAIQRAGARPYARLDDARRALSWLALLLCIVLVARGASPRRLRRAWPVIALAAGALALRVVLPPWAPLHDNAHGIAELRGLLGHVGGPRGNEADRYGVAYRQVCQVAVAMAGRTPTVVFGLGAVAGALTVVPAYALARRVAGSTVAGLLAGLAIAVTPALVVVSPTESPSALTTLLFLAALALGARALARDVRPRARSAAAWAAGLALACACELGPMTLLLLPAAGVAFGVAASPRLVPALRRFALPAVVAGAAGAMHALALLGLRADLSVRPDVALRPALAGLVSDRALWRDGTLTSPALGILALIALVGVARRHGARRAIALALVLVGLWTASCALMAARSDAIRYEALPTALVCVMAGACVIALRHGPGRTALAVATLAAILFGSVPGLLDAMHPSLDAQAYALATRIASSAVVVRVPYTGPFVLDDFPDGEGRARIELVRQGERTGGRPPRCAVWVGPPCWSFTADEVARGDDVRATRVTGVPLRRECVASLGGAAAATRALLDLRGDAVPHRRGELHRVVAWQPRLGLAPCPQ